MPLSDYKVIGVDPDISLDTFDRILREAKSPALGSAHAVWNYCARRRVSPAFLLSMFRQESSFGLQGTATQTRSWGNTRLPNFGGVPEMGTVPGRSGVFPVFANWADGGISTAARFLDHAPYAGKTTVAQIIPVWAPPTDLNDTEAYINAVLASITEWVGTTPVAGTGGTKVALSKPTVVQRPSPNRDGYGSPHAPKAITLHITEGTGQSAVGWLTNPASGASANYVNVEDGTLYELVPPTESAWCNGDVQKPNLANPVVAAVVASGHNANTATISVENAGFTSMGKGGSLTTAQVDSLIRLCAWLCQQFQIPPDKDHIIGHYQWNSVTRPNCPGFSSAEWSSWIGKIAALVGGDVPSEGGDVREPQPEQITSYINAQGNLIVAVNLGGAATKVLGANVADLGGSVENKAGEKFDRSVQANVFKPWVKRP